MLDPSARPPILNAETGRWKEICSRGAFRARGRMDGLSGTETETGTEMD